MPGFRKSLAALAGLLAASTLLIGSGAVGSPAAQDQKKTTVEGGMRAELARLTLARKIAAITLAVWKQQEAFDPARLTLREAQ